MAVGATVVGGLVVAYLLGAIYAFITFTHWIVERRLRGIEPEAPSRPHLDALCSTFVSEFLSAGSFVALHPLGMFDPAPPASCFLQSGRPILLVHGFMQARSNFVMLGSRLAGYGLGPLYTINLPTLNGDLREHAGRLSERIDLICRATGSKQVDVVAHSSGGLVARLAEVGRRNPRIRRLVTLGTPHAGSQMAHMVPGAVARDMRPGSKVLVSLPVPPPGQLVSISSTHDFCVIPPESAQVEPVGRDVIVEHVGHFALLTNRAVCEEVVKALGEDIQVVRRSQDIFDAVETAEPEWVASP